MPRSRGQTAGRQVGGASTNGGHRASAYEQIKEAILGGGLGPMERITEGDVGWPSSSASSRWRPGAPLGEARLGSTEGRGLDSPTALTDDGDRVGK